MSTQKTPLISIITVSYNAASTIEQTILSVINQNFKDFEYIIIDGGSTDGTVDIIKKYQDKIMLWVSEPDKGIYDAMNKGIKMAKGKWVNFMNAGDGFYDYNVLQNIGLAYLQDFHVVYGSINCINKSNSFILKPKLIEEIINSMVFCHQAVFVKKDLLNEYKFDVNFKIAADYNLFYTLYEKKYMFKEVNVVIANYEAEEGISSTSFHRIEKEYAIIRGDWNGVINKFFVFFKAEKKFLLIKIRNILPLRFRVFIKNKVLNSIK